MAVAKYVALANELRKEVLSGRYGPEGGLPSTREIAQNHDLAINTVKVALSRLEGEGLIVQRGGNYYVNGIDLMMTQHVPLPASRLHNRAGYARTLRVNVEPLPEYVKSKIDSPPDGHDVVIRIQVSGEINGHERPLQLTTRYYFLPLSKEQVRHLEQDAEWDPMWDITGILLSRDELSPRPATEHEAAQLNLPSGTSIHDVFEVIRDQDGLLLMAQELILSPRDKLIFEYPFENKP